MLFTAYIHPFSSCIKWFVDYNTSVSSPAIHRQFYRRCGGIHDTNHDVDFVVTFLVPERCLGWIAQWFVFDASYAGADIGLPITVSLICILLLLRSLASVRQYLPFQILPWLGRLQWFIGKYIYSHDSCKYHQKLGIELSESFSCSSNESQLKVFFFRALIVDTVLVYSIQFAV